MTYFRENHDERKYVILVIYDIVDNKRRAQMVKCLEKYGIRVQKSAFEVYISKKKLVKLESEAGSIIDITCDSLRIYSLKHNTAIKTWGIGCCKAEDVIIL